MAKDHFPCRRHDMPFGAQLLARGETRFRLWAPGVPRVILRLLLPDREESLPMVAGPGGWHELVTASAAAGTRYRFDVGGGRLVPDPASRYQPQDVHGPSEVVDPHRYQWQDGGWRGRPWEEAVIYELHVGTFTPAGTFRAAIERLGELAWLGVTAIELMPVADFPGTRNWGYDGVLPFAPDSRYGTPEHLKALVEAAHHKGLMVFLDVVYNHFGPEGNYLHLYAPQFFTDRHHTPWGGAINFDGLHSRAVRDFFVHDGLYWLEEFHMDGLRLDAVHAIADDSVPDILVELAEAVRRGPGRERHVHLVLENDKNQSRYLARAPDGNARFYDAQWNDDFHHALHVLLTGERDGYYADYIGEPLRHLGRTLAEGFAYQGEYSVFRGRPRGEPSRQLPASAFVVFLQNHDQIGNRALGERLAALAPPEALRAGLALVLLAPSVPLLFMGEEFGCVQPFPFFCNFAGDLARAVTAGRRSEFAAFERFRDPASRAAIPDPNAESTFTIARLDWGCLSQPAHAAWLTFVRELLRVRHREIVPRLPNLVSGAGEFVIAGPTALRAKWRCADGGCLALAANLGREAVDGQWFHGDGLIYSCPQEAGGEMAHGRLPPWSVVWAAQAGVRP